jgi:hypothetical protein
MNTTYVDLVLDTGELVRIECPSKYEDELHQTLSDEMKRGDWWSPSQFDECTAEFLGHRVDRVSMRRVVAMM